MYSPLDTIQLTYYKEHLYGTMPALEADFHLVVCLSFERAQEVWETEIEAMRLESLCINVKLKLASLIAFKMSCGGRWQSTATAGCSRTRTDNSHRA